MNDYSEDRPDAGKPSCADCSVNTDFLLGLVGGAAGGILGYFLFFLIARQGFYAIALPGALVGLGCGAMSGRSSTVLGIVSAVAGLLLGIVTEWRFAPFIADKSLLYFVKHLHTLPSVTQILILAGVFLAFWFGRGRRGGVWLRKRKTTQPP